MDKGSRFTLVPIFVIVFLACAAQAAAPVSPPESRFVWEPGEKLTFTWTNENFDGFYYDAQSRTGKETLTIKLDNIKDRSIPENGIVYSTTVETVKPRYSPFGEYAVIGFWGEKKLAGYPEGKSNITAKSGTNLNLLQYISIDDDTNYKLIEGGNHTLSGYVLEVREVNVTSASVILSLNKDEKNVPTSTRSVEAGKNYVYELSDGTLIAVHIDSVFKEKETSYVNLKGIFQVSYKFPVNEGDIFELMKITKVSNRSITERNTLDTVDIKRGRIIELGGNIKLKIADSNSLRVQLYSDRYYEKIEHRGATGSNNLTAWDGLNYPGFWYDIDSGNYSESLVITNMTGRRIPEGGLTYTSYIMRVPYAVTKLKGEDIPRTDGSYVSFRLGGKKYMVKNNGFAELLIAHDGFAYEKKTLGIGYNEFSGETWELGEGYTLTAPSVNYSKDPRKARLVLKRNGVELDDVWLTEKEVYRYTSTEENEMPKLITYLDACFAGATQDMIQFRYTWFVSDNVTQIKEGDSLGVFKVTDVEPDRMVLTNREPIELKTGSSINLLGNLSFYVENSDELRLYPTNMGDTQVMPEGVTINSVSNLSDMTAPVMITTFVTTPVTGRTEKTSGFEAVLSITIILAVYIFRRKIL